MGLIFGMMLLGATPQLEGVIQVARGPVFLKNGQEAASGTLVYSGQGLKVQPGAWAQFRSTQQGSVALSSGTKLAFKEGLRLLSGKIWVQTSLNAPIWKITTPDGALELSPGTSLVVELNPQRGTSLAVEQGQLSVAKKTLTAGQTLELSLGKTSLIRAGGQGHFQLVRAEKNEGLGDLVGLRAFVLQRIWAQTETIPSTQETSEMVTTGNWAQASQGNLGWLLELGLRPPPFFDSEVPRPGPNVEIEVVFPGR